MEEVETLSCEANSFKKFVKKKKKRGQKLKVVKCRKYFQFLLWTLVLVERQHVVNVTYCSAASRARLEFKSHLHTQAGHIPELLRIPFCSFARWGE